MAFKENLMKKIMINELSNQVIRSLGPPGSGSKIDKPAMKTLFEIAGYSPRSERDLDLYLKDEKNEKAGIVVLDNELALYRTIVDDVVLRKSPTVKEMVSIKNAIKILNDKDVVEGKRDHTVRTIEKECIEAIDLSYTASDLEMIAREGEAALENSYGEGVLESMKLFAHLLVYEPAPKAFSIPHHQIWGKVQSQSGGEIKFGPIAIYSLVHNRLYLMEKPISSYDKNRTTLLKAVLKGDEKPSREGKAVFQYLKNAVPPFGK